MGEDTKTTTGQVQLEFVEEPIRLRVNMQLVTWGELLEVQRLQREGADGQATERAVTQLVSRITGEDALQLPAMAVGAVLQALQERAAGTQAKN